MASVFSQIVSGEIPATRVYEDADTLAFMDINPASRGHTLIIAKQEYARLLDVPPEIVAAVAKTVQRVARAIMTGLQADGFNVLQNDGAAAGQVVFHYHVHIIPRWQGDRAVQFPRSAPADSDTLEEVAVQIRAHLV